MYSYLTSQLVGERRRELQAEQRRALAAALVTSTRRAQVARHPARHPARALGSPQGPVAALRARSDNTAGVSQPRWGTPARPHGLAHLAAH